jgi:hypothetical protein
VARFTPNRPTGLACYVEQGAEAQEMPCYGDWLKELDVKWDFWKTDCHCLKSVGKPLGQHTSNPSTVVQIRVWLATRLLLAG